MRTTAKRSSHRGSTRKRRQRRSKRSHWRGGTPNRKHSYVMPDGTTHTPEAVHDMVCEFITAQAEAEASGGGWAGYREVFLSAEVQDLIRSRLMAEPGGAAGSNSDESRSPKKQQKKKKKKRKLDDAVTPAPAPAPAAAADEVLWTVCCWTAPPSRSRCRTTPQWPRPSARSASCVRCRASRWSSS
jgi:hypothetical protein